MDNHQSNAAQEERRQQVTADEDDILVKVLGIVETDYQCVTVNTTWIERGLLAGDIILFAARGNPDEGDIVLIEDEGQTRLGIAADRDYLQTRQGRRPLEWSERIVGVGVALARKLAPPPGKDDSPADQH